MKLLHIDFLVEDISGKVMLERLLPKMIHQDNVTYKVYSYKGIGRIPGKLKSAKTIKNRQLLEQLPRLLNGFGKTYDMNSKYMAGHTVVVCDLDDKDLRDFKAQMHDIVEQCMVKPDARFCFAIEEGEAWLLGDAEAIKQAYPSANISVLRGYQQDSICGTWEVLADATGFSYKNASYQEIGLQKREWAEKITPYMNIAENKSPSFLFFVDNIKDILSLKS